MPLVAWNRPSTGRRLLNGSGPVDLLARAPRRERGLRIARALPFQSARAGAPHRPALPEGATRSTAAMSEFFTSTRLFSKNQRFHRT